jgi:hypothetical protein
MHLPAGAAVDPLLDVGAEGFQLGGAGRLAILQGPAAHRGSPRRRGVATPLQLALDELLEVLYDDAARLHGDLPAAWA